jgi:hypothetical protein
MLDNGYVYLAATRLSLHRSENDWAIVIEVFGFSARAGLPDIHVYTFGSRLHDRNAPTNYVSSDAYDNYLRSNPNNESRLFHPIAQGDWQDSETDEFVAPSAVVVPVRGFLVPIPESVEFNRYGIELEYGPRIQTFELCRFLAEAYRESVLATPSERRVSVPPEHCELLVLEEWNHPNIVDDERPGRSETFRMLAKVLVTGDLNEYRPSEPANSHWSNWPDGGTL